MEGDKGYMRQALECAQKAKSIAPPNPCVGCVIVKENSILASGWTDPPGGEHAELVALKKARKEDLQGSTLYLTLEPCCHRGRTPPCIDAIVRSGIKRVVIGAIDPDPNIRGKGVERLRKANLNVEVGILEKEIEWDLRAYFYHKKQSRSYTLLKAIQSVDGCVTIDNSSVTSILDDKGKKDSHLLRDQSQAILIGAKTVLHDNPHLTVRHIPNNGSPPLRVVLDRRDTIPLNANVFKTDSVPTLCITSGQKERNEVLLSQGVDTLSWNKSGPIPCSFIQGELAKRDVLQLLVEGGIMTISHFLQERAFNELVVYIGPKILGKKGKRFSDGLMLSSLTESPFLQLTDIRQFDDSLRLTYHHTCPLSS